MKISRAIPRQPQINFCIVCAAIAMAVASQVQAETTINFEGTPGTGGLADNDNMPQTYGDFVSSSGNGIVAGSGLSVVGTPNIDLSWGTNVNVPHVVDWYQGWDGRGTVAQVDYDTDGGAPISLTFTPDAGWGVLIRSFDLDEWAGGGSMSVDWSISDSLGTLASSTWTRSAGGRDNILTGLDPVAVHAGETVQLTFHGTSGQGSYFAVDNLVFDQIQPVPEPMPLALMSLGGVLGIIQCVRRRK